MEKLKLRLTLVGIFAFSRLAFSDIATQHDEAKNIDELKAGKRLPQSFSELLISQGAEDGMSIARQPKIRADGKLYGLSGRIFRPHGDDSFVAYPSTGYYNEVLVKGLRGFNEDDNKHFVVYIPENLKAKYLESARIEGGFNLIGNYVDNVTYTTRLAPVFTATYFELWGDASSPDEAVKAYSDRQKKPPDIREEIALPMKQEHEAEETERAANEWVRRYFGPRVARVWLRPSTAQSGASCTISIRLTPGGDVASANASCPGADAAYESSAEAAVKKAAPFPIPPDPLVLKLLLGQTVNFRFNPN